MIPHLLCILFFFNDTAPTEIYTLSLHDALPIFLDARLQRRRALPARRGIERDRDDLQGLTLDGQARITVQPGLADRSEEHTSELQSQFHLVCRLLLEKKKKKKIKKSLQPQ